VNSLWFEFLVSTVQNAQIKRCITIVVLCNKNLNLLLTFAYVKNIIRFNAVKSEKRICIEL
jgi:hypothetical protein